MARKAPEDASVPFTLPHFRAWASELILDTDEPWVLDPFQEAFITDLFAGHPECWLIVPEGNGKTTLLAGLALYHCEFRPHASVGVAAASREQAQIMYSQAEGFVLRSPRLTQLVHSEVQAAKGKRKTEVPLFTCLEGYRRINHHAGGRIQVYAADDRTGDGVIPTLGIIDEPHRQKDLALYRTWSGKISKRKGQIAAISTAGTPGSDFEVTRARIHETAEQRSQDGAFTRVVSKRIVMHEWALPESADPEDIEAVKSANPFRGITTEMLRDKLTSPTMTMHHWLRFVCNRATEDLDIWLGPDGARIWDSLTDPWKLEPGGRTWVGVDFARKRDSTAVVAIQQRPDEEGKAPSRLHMVLRLWVPTEDRPVDTTDVMQHLRELATTYSVEAIAFDPWNFDTEAAMLLDEGLPMIEVPQSIEKMSIAVRTLYAGIMGGTVTHDDDPRFTRHVLDAVPRFNERGFTLTKSKSRGRIDAAVAAAMAIDRAERTESSDSIYDERALVEL